MTEFSYPWDLLEPGDAGPYSSEQWAAAWRALFQGSLAAQQDTGVLLRTGDNLNSPLSVTVDSPNSASVRVYPGSALVAGRFYNSDDIEFVTISANGTVDPRIDRIVLRVIFADQTIRLHRLQGTPAAIPVAPTLTQNNVIYEIPLAQILVPSGFLTITGGITDERVPLIQGTDNGGTGINTIQNPYTKGDLLAAASAQVLSRLAVGATNGMRLSVDSSQTLGVKWVNSRPSIVANNVGGAAAAMSNTVIVVDTIVSDGAGNIASINGSGHVIMNPGTYKVKASLSWTHNTSIASAIGQLVLYNNAAAANVLDVTGATVLSNGNNIVTAVVGGGTSEIPEHICTFDGTEQLSLRIVTGFTVNSFIRRTKNPIITFERVF